MLNAKDIIVRYGGQTVVNRLSLTLKEGEWLMLAGPNGAGKSTLIAALSQSVPYAGEVLLNGRSARTLRPAQLARQMGVLSQQHAAGYDYTVEEIVRLGRYAHRQGFLSGRDPAGESSIRRALEETGMDALRSHTLSSLSGGEVQRAFLAQVFAQDPGILLLDEPANHLDLVYQQHLFTLIGEWLRRPGRAVISVVHDLALARRYGTHAVLMDRGTCVAAGKTDEVFTPDNLKQVYRMDVYAWMQGLLAPWTGDQASPPGQQ